MKIEDIQPGEYYILHEDPVDELILLKFLLNYPDPQGKYYVFTFYEGSYGINNSAYTENEVRVLLKERALRPATKLFRLLYES
jgi:hypothetical protein